jgi:DNA-binding CsgD family transcriptional regulator
VAPQGRHPCRDQSSSPLRLARISPPTRRVLLAASALARPTVDLVLEATASDGSTRSSLDQAVDAEVVAVHSGAVRFTHPLLSSVLYAEASAEERRRLYRRRLRRQRAARESLDEARQLFETLRAARWTDRATTELARIAGRASNPFALTPTEEQVATLVADGRTNPEVAASLFISVKTVEANLTRIYRKLGVSSRRELTRRIQDIPPSAQFKRSSWAALVPPNPTP